MILEIGDIVLVSNRRMFERDETRYFLGRTIATDGTLLKAEGYSFVKDLGNGQIVKKEERRIKVLSIASPGHIVYQLPSDIIVDDVDIESGEGDAYLSENGRRILNLSERAHCGHF